MKKVKNKKIDKNLISIEAVCIYIIMPLLFFFTIKTPNIIIINEIKTLHVIISSIKK